MRTTVGLLVVAALLIGAGVVPGQAQPSTSDLAWQAVGTTAGMTVGTVAGTLASVPGVVLSLPAWVENPNDPQNACFPDMDQDAFSREDGITLGLCLFQVAIPVVSFTAGSASGGAVGGLIGLLLVADSQGQDGSLVGAGLGLLAGQALSTAVVESQWGGELDEIIEAIQEEDRDWEAYLDSTSDLSGVAMGTLTSIAIPLGAVAGYNLF